MRFFILIAFSLSFYFSHAQYNNPYRITYDGSNYYVTNKGNGTVTEIDSNFNTSTVISGLFSPNDIFFGTFGGNSAIAIVDSNSIKLFDPSTFGSILNIGITGAVEAHDGVFNPNNNNEFFISDRAGNKIIKGSIGAPPFYPITYTTLLSDISKPAGMIFDHRDRLLVVTDTANSEIHWVDISTGYDSLVYSGSINDFNDISQDNEKNYYVNSWDDDYLYRMDSLFGNPTKLVAFNNPAGMYVNSDYDYLAMCCYNCNKIEYLSYHLFSPLGKVSVCETDSFYVDFSPTYNGIGTYNSNNQWIFELSDSNGSFAAPLQVASIAADTVPNFFHTMLPKRDYADSGYLYRFRSTSPAVNSYFSQIFDLTLAPNPYIYTSDTLSICTGSSVILGGTAANNTSYTWSPSTYLNNQNTSSVTFSGAPVDNYDIQLTTEDTITGCGDMASIHIKVGPNLSIPQLADSLAICKGDSIEVGVDGLPYFFSWSGSDSLNSASDGNPHFYDIKSSLLKVIFSDFSLSCSGTDSVYVQVYDPPSINPLSWPNDSACISTDFSLNLTLDNQVNYSWSSAGGPINTDSLNPIFNFGTAGDFIIQVQMVDQMNGCTNEDSLLVRIHPRPVLFPFPSYTERSCRTDRHTLEFNADSSFDYLWTIKEGDVFNADSMRPSFQVDLPIEQDSIFVEFTDRNGCISQEIMLLDILYKPNNVTLTEGNGVGADYVVTNDQRLMLELNIANPNLLVSWYVNGSLVLTSGDSTGWFLRNDFSHGDSLRAKYTRINGPDTLCEFWSDNYVKTNLGSISNMDAQFKVYPNPLKAGAYLHWANNLQIDEVQLQTIEGKVLFSGLTNRLQIDQSGIYIIRFRIGDQWFSKRLAVH